MELNFCTQCGKKLVYKDVGDEGPQKYCSHCKRFYFDDPKVCVLAAIIKESDKNQILLLKQNYISTEKYVLCSGYVQTGETLEEAVYREVMEETGYFVYEYEYIGSYYYPPKDIVMPGFIAYADDRSLTLEPKSKEVDEMLWVDLDKAADMILRINNLSGVHLDRVIEKITGKHCSKGSVSTEYFVAFMDSHSKYLISFENEKLISDYHDVCNFNKAVEQMIKPEKTYFVQSFIKDNVYVKGCWDDCYGYSWRVEVKTEEELKKVLEWATAASEEFMKMKEENLFENKGE